jgi:hypothetical protein
MKKHMSERHDFFLHLKAESQACPQIFPYGVEYKRDILFRVSGNTDFKVTLRHEVADLVRHFCFYLESVVRVSVYVEEHSMLVLVLRNTV